jgi:dTDP-3-amino-2,3,6-trideoxy-4-keto-D-glucose/dTDP-3-amino-3,4,6-trideoxy-alpha-D-glucose/dTDP-2,6-dideoxy-D-kanosamine transaminase
MTVLHAAKNFLPDQYDRTQPLPINHNYLRDQFADVDAILAKVRAVVVQGDFTLGRAVDRLEERYAAMLGAKFAVGLNSGTDALRMGLIAVGVKPGDEVITTPYTFYATIGAIVTVGARPVFVDVGDDMNLDPARIKAAITNKTRAILPVHWSGRPCVMDELNAIAREHGLKVVEDACHAVQATYDNKFAGTLGDVGCFSFHPLKNLNVWGDGGILVTNDEKIASHVRLIRNHGLIDRDHCAIFSFNTRLDTVQAVVADHLLDRLDHITASRIANAQAIDRGLAGVKQVRIPKRNPRIKEVFHLYCIECERRDELQTFLISKGIDAKVHYPIPMHLQPAAQEWGYKQGDFPRAESVCANELSLPVHEFITAAHTDEMIGRIREFYS